MAAESGVCLQVEVQAHHEQKRVCDSRAKYRDGRRPRAVKVYTINLESRYLLIQGVPAIGVMKELVEQFALYGVIEEYNALDEYPTEEFTEVYLLKFQRLQSARVAKRKMDERSFFGGLLHVCYAPEFETVQETREKLQDRRRFVARATSDKARNAPERKPEATRNTGCPFESSYPESDASLAHGSSYNSQLQHSSPTKSGSTVPFARIPEFNQSCTPHSFPILSDSNPVAHKGNFQQTTEPWPLEKNPQTSIPIQTNPSAAGSNFLRFTPRTTQLQERQRKREHRNALALCGSSSDNQDIVIGPKLPEMPKLDMDDPSLNMSADFIRDKLKKVGGTPLLPKLHNAAEDAQAEAPKKQRRRI
uniref:RNA-binding protein 48 n=1 Tax=Leptobrachium leishanense TaxID=445787 RepID=A0A8C5Q7L6_9ANUR